jgi:multimeric flavodoxin WrbA
MKAIAINGSPRKKWNTAILLENALSGCRANGAETEMVHLYAYTYQGCTSCFSCKLIGGKSYGRCNMQDALRPILDRASQADILILGSPFYFHAETGEMRSFMERLLFPYLTYTPDHASIFPREIPAALVYTMNVTEQDMSAFYQDTSVAASRAIMTRIFGSCEVLLCTDTYQFADYSKYLSTAWDADAKARRHKDQFPRDCEHARELGASLVAAAG